MSDYSDRYRSAEAPPLVHSKPLDIFPELPSPVGFRAALTWADPWPLGDRAGVYFIFSGSFELLYIGKSKFLGQRLSSHFGAGNKCVMKENWSVQPRYVITVAVPIDVPFEASALEDYLIQELRPPLNVSGIESPV